MKPIIVIALALSCASCSRNNTDTAWWQNEAKIIELNQKIELTNYRLSQLSEMEKTLRDPVSLEEEVRSLRGEIENIKNRIALMDEQWPDFRRKILQARRMECKGEHSDEMITAKGKEFHNVRVVNINDGGVLLRHSTGSARLSASDLSSEEQIRFGIDPSLALAVYKEEETKRQAHETLVAAALEQKRIADKKLEKSHERRLLELAVAASQTRPQTSPFSDFTALGETKTFPSSSSSYTRRSSYSNQYNRPNSTTVYYRYITPTYNTPSNSCTTATGNAIYVDSVLSKP